MLYSTYFSTSPQPILVKVTFYFSPHYLTSQYLTFVLKKAACALISITFNPFLYAIVVPVFAVIFPKARIFSRKFHLRSVNIMHHALRQENKETFRHLSGTCRIKMGKRKTQTTRHKIPRKRSRRQSSKKSIHIRPNGNPSEETPRRRNHRPPSKRTQPKTAPPRTLIFVYSQLLERPSINKMEEWLNQTDILKTLGIERITTAQLYDA